MGNYSYLKNMLDAEDCLINWDKADLSRLLKYWIFKDAYKSLDERPKTLADMAKLWDGKKFIGYLKGEYIDAMMEFCRILEPCGVNPLLDYEYDANNMLFSFEFCPGTENIYFSYLIYDDWSPPEKLTPEVSL